MIKKSWMIRFRLPMIGKPRKIKIRLPIDIVFVLASLGLCVFLLISCDRKSEPPPEPPPVVNTSPVAYAPFTATMSFTKGARVDYDLRYREHGCDAAGHPTSVTGARDPDGDELEYRVSCEWTVFDQSRRKVNGKWMSFPKDDRGEQVAIVTLFVGWVRDEVPYPFAPKCAAGGETATGCQPSPQPTPFTYEVRDGKGGTASHTVIVG